MSRCSDSEGNHLGCAIDVWQHSAPNTSAVTTDSSPKDKIGLFMSMFCGRQDVFGKRFGSGLLTRTMTQRHELNFKSYDRMFPSQDTLTKGGFGNLIALPFQGQAQKNGNSLFIDEYFESYQDQWAFLSTVPRITSAQLEEYHSELCTDSDLGQLGEKVEAKKRFIGK